MTRAIDTADDRVASLSKTLAHKVQRNNGKDCKETKHLVEQLREELGTSQDKTAEEYEGPTSHNYPLGVKNLANQIESREHRGSYLPAYLQNPPEMDPEASIRRIIFSCVFYTEDYETHFALLQGSAVYSEWDGGKQEVKKIVGEAIATSDVRYANGPKRWTGSIRPF